MHKPDVCTCEQYARSARIALFCGRRQEDVVWMHTGGFDMDVMNDLYRDHCLVLPNEWRAARDESHQVPWRQLAAMECNDFSDFPLPKPWLVEPEQLRKNTTGPVCPSSNSCSERQLWLCVYATFRDGMRHC